MLAGQSRTRGVPDDFERVASVLESWLGLASREALGGAFELLPLFHG